MFLSNNLQPKLIFSSCFFTFLFLFSETAIFSDTQNDSESNEEIVLAKIQFYGLNPNNRLSTQTENIENSTIQRKTVAFYYFSRGEYHSLSIQEEEKSLTIDYKGSKLFKIFRKRGAYFYEIASNELPENDNNILMLALFLPKGSGGNHTLACIPVPISKLKKKNSLFLNIGKDPVRFAWGGGVVKNIERNLPEFVDSDEVAGVGSMLYAEFYNRTKWKKFHSAFFLKPKKMAQVCIFFPTIKNFEVQYRVQRIKLQTHPQ